MKRSIFTIVIVSIVFGLASSSRASDVSDSNKAKLAESLKAWTDLKAKCGGNYSYKVSFTSWVGFGHETTIVVRDNKVVERRYREWSANLQGPPMPVPPGVAPPQPQGTSWTETGDQLGSHPKGAPLKTLDTLYEEAEKILEIKLEPYQRLYVRFDGRGLLLMCAYVDTRIMDDAPMTGVRISSIQIDESAP